MRGRLGRGNSGRPPGNGSLQSPLVPFPVAAMPPSTYRRRFGVALAAAALGCTLPIVAHAQSFPSKPVKLVVPFPPGGSLDNVGRLLAQKLTEAWGQQVVVENRPGAGGNVGADAVAKSPADGYAVVMGALSTHAVNPSLTSTVSATRSPITSDTGRLNSNE